MTPWAHLPNAAFIDEVLACAEADPEKWGAAWNTVRDATPNAAWTAAWAAARGAAWGAARGTVWSASLGATWNATAGVIASLVAYDDAGQFMKLPVEHLQRLYRIDPHPTFLLLQPAAVVFSEQVATP